MTDTVQLEEWARGLAHAAPPLDAASRQLWIHTYRALAGGGPVTPGEIAVRSGLSSEVVEQHLRSWPLVLWDGDSKRVIGFWGLHVLPIEPTHVMDVDGTTLYGWCAEDTLFIPEILGQEARVGSTDPLNGNPIRLTVSSEGVENLDPPEAVVSFLLPEDGFTDDAIARFCHQIHFFTTPQSAEEWTADRPGTFHLTVRDAFQLGKMTNRLRFGPIDQAGEG